MNNELIKRIDDELSTPMMPEPVRRLLRDCKAEIERLNERHKESLALGLKFAQDRETMEAEIERLNQKTADLEADVKAQKEKLLNTMGMADCMDMVMQELQGAGIIDKDVAPMFLPEAIVSKLKKPYVPMNAHDWMLFMADRYFCSYEDAQKIEAEVCRRAGIEVVK